MSIEPKTSEPETSEPKTSEARTSASDSKTSSGMASTVLRRYRLIVDGVRLRAMQFNHLCPDAEMATTEPCAARNIIGR